jgi:tRNA(Leu) C34 or U34 (ribose-2'-O)-methylase TrmL
VGEDILEIIQSNFRYHEMFQAFWYNDELQGFLELKPDTIITVTESPWRINIVLEPNAPEPISPVDSIMLRSIQSSYCPHLELDREDEKQFKPRVRTDPEWRDKEDEYAGWFSMGIYRGKTEPNHGTLWRSAYQLGAAYIFSIGARYNRNSEEITDVYNSWQKIPFFQYSDWESFMQATPYGCPWVAVEIGGTPLPDFEHPKRAIYFLGSEDLGLPSSIIDHCHFQVSIPSVRKLSFNVATAGSLIMYDRLQKQQAKMKSDTADLAKIIQEHYEILAAPQKGE